MQHRSILRASAAAVFALAGVQAAHATSYHLVDLGLNKMPTQVNNQGDIAGYGYIDEFHSGDPLKYHNGTWARLPSPNGASEKGSWTVGIDSQGDVGGYTVSDETTIWPHGRATPFHLQMPDGSANGVPTAIGPSEQLVGYWNIVVQNETAQRCFVWAPATGAVDLGMMDTGVGCVAFGVNASGQVVGYSATAGRSVLRAFLWEQGQFRGLGVLSGDQVSGASGINDQGHVIGWSGSKDRTISHAFTWSGGAMTNLAAGSAFADYSLPMAINSRGQIVGYGAASSTDPEQAVDFTGGQPVALSTEVVDPLDDWQLQIAVSVNDRGVIVGQGQRADGMHGFMLAPVR